MSLRREGRVGRIAWVNRRQKGGVDERVLFELFLLCPASRQFLSLGLLLC